MGQRLIGFEGKVYHGTAGSTASTELTIVREVNYAIDPSEADVSDRASIIEYSRTAMVKFSIDMEVNNDASNAFVAAIRAAAVGGGTIALRLRDKTSGWGPDGDFNVKLDESQPLKDAQRLKLSFTPNNDTRSLSFS